MTDSLIRVVAGQVIFAITLTLLLMGYPANAPTLEGALLFILLVILIQLVAVWFVRLRQRRTGSKIGVLALQGAFREHIEALRALGVEAVEVRPPEELERLDGLIIPGGESTAIGKL